MGKATFQLTEQEIDFLASRVNDAQTEAQVFLHLRDGIIKIASDRKAGTIKALNSVIRDGILQEIVARSKFPNALNLVNKHWNNKKYVKEVAESLRPIKILDADIEVIQHALDSNRHIDTIKNSVNSQIRRIAERNGVKVGLVMRELRRHDTISLHPIHNTHPNFLDGRLHKHRHQGK